MSVPLITSAGEAVALVVGGDLALLDPELEARSFGDPVLRFAAAMSRLAMEIERSVARVATPRNERSAPPANC